MPSYDLTHRRPDQARRRRALLTGGTLLIAGALAVTVITGDDGTGETTELGPTTIAAPRDLATTLGASGALQRSSEHTVAYAGALSSDDGTALPEESGDDPDDTDAVTPVAYVTETTTTTSTTTNPCPPTTTSSTTSTTTSPCPPTATSSTTTPTSTSASTSSTTPTTTSPTTTSTTIATPTSTTPSTRPGSGDNSAAPTGNGDSAPTDNGDSAAPTDNGDSAAPTDGDGDDGSGVSSATLTSVLDVGATAGRGTVLYTADEQPVVALSGDLPAWRTLEDGVDDGSDIQQLEENLAALGYDPGDVDETFTDSTATAVETWETDLGRAAPDGTVTIGDIVFLTTPGDVLDHDATVGDTLETGSPVLTIGSEQRIVVANVDATEAGGWAPGSTVELEWADTTTTTGTIFGVGREVTDGQVELIVAVGAGDSGAGDRRSGAAATVTLVDATRDDVIAVPVAAIVEDSDTTAVPVVQDDGPDNLVAVETGLVADGWIEITAGLDGGEEIRLPG